MTVTFCRNIEKPRVAFQMRKLKKTQGYNAWLIPRKVKDHRGNEKRVFCVIWSAGFPNLRKVIHA